MATTAVTLDGFPLIGATPGGGTARVTRPGLDGWLRAVTSRPRSRRTGGHGTVAGRGWRTEKPITISGQIIYTSPAAAAAERRQLLALGGFGECDLVVTDSLGTLRMGVEVDEASVPPLNDRLLEFEFEVTAGEFPFATAVSTTPVPLAAGGTASVSNGGTAVAEFEALLTSAGTVSLTVDGMTLSTGSLPSGSVIRSIDRTIVDGSGTDIYSLIVPGSQWPGFPPGTVAAAQAGSAGLSLSVFDTYA